MESIRVTITETNNLVEVTETEILVSVQEETIAVILGTVGSSGGGTSDLTIADLADAPGEIDVAVATTGSDTPTGLRPAKLRPGDYTLEPFATLHGALACIPHAVNRVVMNFGLGNFQGDIVHGIDRGTVDIVGAWQAATLATGAQTGTAGAGSGATVLNKPTAAANWTANDLVGKLVRITGGAGYLGTDAFTENVLRIVSNTTTQAVLESSMYGLDATSTFEIVQEGTVFNVVADELYQGVSTILGIVNTGADVRMRRCRVDNTNASALYGLVTAQTQYVDIGACGFTAALVVPGYSSNLRMLSTHLKAASYLYCYGQNVMLLNGIVGEGSTIQFERFVSLDASNLHMNGDVGYWNAVAIMHGGIATIGGDISNASSATPLLAQNVRQFSIAGALTGSNAAQTYGAQVQGGGQFNLAGMTLAGNDANKVVRVESAYNLSYAQISGNGCHQCKGTFIIGGGPATNVFLDDVQVVSGQMYMYGVVRPLGNAYKEVTAFATGGQTSATPAGYIGTKVTVAGADHDSVRLLGAGDLTITGGLPGYIINATAFIVDLFPPSGQKIFLDGVDQGVNTQIEVQPGEWLSYVTDNNGNYWVKA